MKLNQVHQGHAYELAQQIPDGLVNCIITSPPYLQLRDYGVEPQSWPEVTFAPMAGLPPLTIPAQVASLGLEADPWAYVGHLVALFRELRRGLRDDGVAWLNLGDSFATGTKASRQPSTGVLKHHTAQDINRLGTPIGLKTKDLLGVPWRVAFALQADGWYLRRDVIWAKGVSFLPDYAGSSMPECLDPETTVFIKRNNWVSKITLAQLANLNELPEILSPNGWVQIRKVWKTKKPAIAIEAGKVERLICSPDHRFPVSSDRRRIKTRLERAEDIRHEGYADYLLYSPIDRYLPESMMTWMGQPLNYNLGYLIGVYVAEGGHNDKYGYRIKLTININENSFMEKIKATADCINLTTMQSDDLRSNSRNIFITEKWFTRTVDSFVSGTVKKKALNIEIILNTPRAFRQGILDGYVDGDGSNRKGGGWIAASASQRLRDDIATLASSVGIITSKGFRKSLDKRTGKTYNGFALWTPYMTKRKTKSGTDGVYQVPPRRRRHLDGTREMIDLEVDGHIFLIGDGLVTHNSVQDRPSTSHEYLFLLSKSRRYWYDSEAVKEQSITPPGESWEQRKLNGAKSGWRESDKFDNEQRKTFTNLGDGTGRNLRSVWVLNPQPFPGAHFAVFPPALVEPCLLAGCPEQVCAECGAPWVRVVEKTTTFESGSGKSGNMPIGKNGSDLQGGGETLDIRRGPVVHSITTGHRPTCTCPLGTATRPGIVLDPFLGSGTTARVAIQHRRQWLGFELNPEYVDLVGDRTDKVQIAMGL